MSFKDGQTGIPVEAGRESNRGGPEALVDVGGDRLRYGPPPGGDLMEVEMLEVVCGEVSGVTFLQVPSNLRVQEVDHWSFEVCRGRGQHVPDPPGGGHRRVGKIPPLVLIERRKEGLYLFEIRSEVRQDLPQRGLLSLGAVDGAKTPVGIIEALAGSKQIPRQELERAGDMPDPPKWSVVHASKLASCRAARSTSANSSGSVAFLSTPIGARSSRRVLVPNSQARTVLSSNASLIMRVTL